MQVQMYPSDLWQTPGTTLFSKMHVPVQLNCCWERAHVLIQWRATFKKWKASCKKVVVVDVCELQSHNHKSLITLMTQTRHCKVGYFGSYDIKYICSVLMYLRLAIYIKLQHIVIMLIENIIRLQ